MSRTPAAGGESTQATAHLPGLGRLRIGLALAGVLTVAVFLRFYRLETVPPGLWHDEAFNGLDALRVLSGEFPVIFEANHGRQPLFIYLQAGAVALLGATPEALRATSALVGVLTVASVYFLARELESDGARGRQAGVLAAGLLAVMPWHVHFSRYGLRAILFPLLVCWFLFFLWRALRYGRWADYAAAGAALAGAFYTYIAAVLLPPLAAAVVVLRLRGRPWPPRLLGGTVLSLGVALTLLAPLLLYYLDHPGLAFGRPADVSLFNPARAEAGLLSTGLGNLVATVGMFFWAGSLNWRHNVAGWPLLDPLSGALLLLGLAGALAGWRRRDHQLLLLAAGVLLLPSVLSSEGLPHAKYALGMAPVAAVLMARGTLGALAGVASRLGRSKRRSLLPIGPALIFIVGAATTYRLFIVWAPSPEVYFAYESDARAAAEALPGLAAGVPNLQAVWAHVADPDQTVILRFLAPALGEKIVSVGHQNELGPLPASGLPLLFLVPASQRFVPPDLGDILGVRPSLGPPAPTGEPAFRAFSLTDTRVPAAGYVPPLPLTARLGGAVELRGASVTPTTGEDRGALVSLFWRPLADPGPEARLFFHLLDGAGRTRGQAHFSPRPQYTWDPAALAKDGLVSWFVVPLDAAAPPGDYRLVAGLSPTLGDAALAVESRGSEVLANRVLLGAISLGPSPVTPALRSLALDGVSNQEVAPGLRLLGYRLSGRQALPGDTLSLALYWQALRPDLPDYQVAAWPSTTLGLTERPARPPGGETFPTSAWRLGEVVEDLRDLHLPARAPAGQAEIRLVALTDSGQPTGPPLTLAHVTVTEPSRAFALPPLTCCIVGVRLGTVASLEAVHLDAPPSAPGLWSGQPGETLTATLYWRAQTETDTGYKVFLHLVSGQGAVATQHDSVPALGSSPTTGWVPQQVIADAHPLTLPSTLASGRYRLLAGLYDEATGRRLATEKAGDAVELGALSVGSP